MDHLRLPANIDITEFLMYMKFRFYNWLKEWGYQGEKPNFGPAFDDNILSLTGASVGSSEDSPHMKIPWSIAYRVKRSLPFSQDPPFGKKKQWKYRHCGYFKDDAKNYYQIRMKEWENLIEFIIIGRSNLQADVLTRVFENFVNTNHGYFQKAGLAAIRPLGRIHETEDKLENAGVHYRKTQFWAHTQTFYVSGPFAEISNIEINTELPDF